MTWVDRVRPSIGLTSPEGNVFDALWRDDERSKEKKLGIFQFPKIKGAEIQDLEIGATSYPLTILFDGPDNDIESERFFKACDERGTWEIIHPVKGNLVLQLVSVGEQISPTESGNVTEFNTVWLEPSEREFRKSSAQLKSEVISQIDTVNDVGGDQLDANVIQEKAEETKSFEQSMRNMVAAVDSKLSPLFEKSAEINAQVQSIKRGIDVAITSIPFDLLSIAGQVQQLIQLPGLAVRDIGARISAFRNLADTMFGLRPNSPAKKNLNVVSVQEISLTSVVIGSCFAAVTGDLASRSQAVTLIDSIADLFSDVVNELDGSQELFGDEGIEFQYFSQSQTYSDTALLVATTLSYLLRSSFDLVVEKRFTLDRQRAPLGITITEYGGPGVNDSNLDLFIQSNGLKGQEIAILPAGREVVVYI
jgi:hypothetical protein